MNSVQINRGKYTPGNLLRRVRSSSFSLGRRHGCQGTWRRDHLTHDRVEPLAKRLEEVWLPGQEYPVVLPRTSEGLYLLQRVRDEAHRFAVTAQRKQRAIKDLRSELLDVPGVGAARAVDMPAVELPYGRKRALEMLLTFPTSSR